jgi:hypothetical protein
MSELPRQVLLHAAAGFPVAALFVGLLVASDPGGLGTLLMRAESAPGPVLLLWLFSGLTFGAALAATALCSGGEGAGRSASPVLLPVRVRRRR